MILTGLARIGRDTELRYTSGGEAVANISMVFNYGKKGNDGKRPSQWIEASLWGKRAESLAQYLGKGSMIDVVLSEPHIETYQGKNGEGHKLVARVIEIELACGRSEDKPADKPNKTEKANSGGGFQDFESDIPFLPITRKEALVL